MQIDPRTMLWGPKRYSHENVGEPVAGTVRMPHGDDHNVTLQLQQRTFGRTGRRRKQQSWIVDWAAERGIPTRPTDRGNITASAVEVSARGVEEDGWVGEACAAIALKLSADRARWRYSTTLDA